MLSLLLVTDMEVIMSPFMFRAVGHISIGQTILLRFAIRCIQYLGVLPGKHEQTALGWYSLSLPETRYYVKLGWD